MTASINPSIVTREAWLEQRRALLAEEKAFTRARDALTKARQALPWVAIGDYSFTATQGPTSLSELFGSKSQLVIYHFMFGPDAQTGCKSCSFWADNFERTIVHLAERDVAFAVVSRADVAKLDAFKKRLGWTFPWVSSGKSSFNADFGVHFSPEQQAAKTPLYNFGTQSWFGDDMHGISVFAKTPNGALFHTYSCFARGLEDFNVAYRYLDIVPKGRNETEAFGMAWVKLHDQYGGNS